MPVTKSPVPVPVPRMGGFVVAVPLDQKAVVLRGKGTWALLDVGDAAGAVVRIMPVPVVSITPVPVPVPSSRGRNEVAVPLDHAAVVFKG